MINNAPIRPDFKPLPEGWRTRNELTQVFSCSSLTISVYNAPKFKGEIRWQFNEFYGELGAHFIIDGKHYHACNKGENLKDVLGVPDDYCVRTGKDGWMKILEKDGFEQWLKDNP